MPRWDRVICIHKRKVGASRLCVSVRHGQGYAWESKERKVDGGFGGCDEVVGEEVEGRGEALWAIMHACQTSIGLHSILVRVEPNRYSALSTLRRSCWPVGGAIRKCNKVSTAALGTSQFSELYLWIGLHIDRWANCANAVVHVRVRVNCLTCSCFINLRRIKGAATTAMPIECSGGSRVSSCVGWSWREPCMVTKTKEKDNDSQLEICQVWIPTLLFLYLTLNGTNPCLMRCFCLSNFIWSNTHPECPLNSSISEALLTRRSEQRDIICNNIMW